MESFKALQVLLFYLLLSISVVILPIVSFFGYLVRSLVFIITRDNPEYGKLLGYIDIHSDEDFTNSPPKCTIVTTLTLDGPLSLPRLRELFTRNVLNNATIIQESTGQSVLRYPELQQYICSYWGFKIWRNQPDFNVDQHIKQEPPSNEPVILSSFLENLINKSFPKNKSPWEIILTGDQQLLDEDHNKRSPKSVLSFRIHHSMADAKSILKCFVECLGEKELKTAESLKVPPKNKLIWYLKFPLIYGKLFWYSVKMEGHPWKTLSLGESDPCSGSVPLVVRLSGKLELRKLKQVAREHGLLTSSVILGVVGGAIGKFDLRGDEIFVGFPQNKEGHPKEMTNHIEMGAMMIPTSGGGGPLERIKKCNEIQMGMKLNDVSRYVDVLARLLGNLPWKLRRIVGVNYFVPVAVTNIAGEMEGFGVGGVDVKEFTMGVGTFQGCCGVTFCCFSYRDGLRVAVAGKETLLSGERAQQLANQVEKELDLVVLGCLKK